MAKSAKTVVEVVELAGSKVLLVEVLTTEQLEWVYEVFEPYSRKYRGSISLWLRQSSRHTTVGRARKANNGPSPSTGITAQKTGRSSTNPLDLPFIPSDMSLLRHTFCQIQLLVKRSAILIPKRR